MKFRLCNNCEKTGKCVCRGGASLCVIVGAFLLFLFDHFGELALARPILYSVAIIVITVAMRWKLGRGRCGFGRPWLFLLLCMLC